MFDLDIDLDLHLDLNIHLKSDDLQRPNCELCLDL